MSTFKNAAKSRQKTHRERAQPASRAHLGFLEKKKDYKARARDFQKKRDALKALRRKALDRNPDEFYFKMVKTKLEDGVHQCEDDTPTYTDDQLKLMASQDVKYINYKRTIEMRKIEKLRSGLHMLDGNDRPKNKHTFFVDSKEKANKFDPLKHHHMPSSKKDEQAVEVDAETLAKIARQRKQKYKELACRIEREKELRITSEKMAVQKHLMDKATKRSKVKEETKESAAVYKWDQRRKR